MIDIFKSRDGVQRQNVNLGNGSYGEVTTPRTQCMFRTTFDKAITGGVDPDYFQRIGPIGTGIALNQTGGNLVITSGTTANAELVLRSTKSFAGSFVARWQTILSQRIANNNFYVELVDVIGDGLAYTINSATSVTITIPDHKFSSGNVGQSITIGAITGAAGIPGRYAIASVAGSTVTFTVAGWPASGSGTCSLFGWNFHRTLYTGTTATTANYDSGRNGYASGDTAATINTTASPGHMGIMTVEEGSAGLIDSLVASASQTTFRASRVVNIARDDAELFVQLRCTNGTVAPASTTTWTIGMVGVTNYDSVNVAINNVRPQIRTNGGAPVIVEGGNLTGIATVTTVTGVTTVSTVTNVTNAGTPTAPATPYFVNSAATTNGALVLTGTSGLQALYATNIGATAAFVKLYNKATAPTVGTDVPEMIIPVPAAVSGVPGVAQIRPGFNGYRFALGLGIAITGGVADSDTTAVAAGQVKVKLSRTI
jgi:hypothetical protein